ncbi:hypothetical protein OnM2_048016 [Erysiphe neolycopersici]|uniref:Uncharacterized protein n=1 Tax=Erysiphe neolycopersici TaxID=212602 RepID=A0A420HTD0_9PEZI|nr:hypothetical protein OnM2_048016 [Erysiphe neolycopersici]
MAGFVQRENRVPYYQRLFFDGQKKHIRIWETISRTGEEENKEDWKKREKISLCYSRNMGC